MTRACLFPEMMSKEPERASTPLAAARQEASDIRAQQHSSPLLILRNARGAQLASLASHPEGDRIMAADTPHDLHSEFPEHGEALHALKMNNAHFRALSDHYHELNRAIHRIEAGIEAAADERLEEMKKQRLVLLDEVALMLRETASNISADYPPT
jgi:uncharacterized protein